MIFSRLWIIRRLVFVIFFLMADLIFSYGTAGYQIQSKGNSSTGTRGVDYNLINNYFKTVLNKTKALEEVIYSDILNNLRSLIKTEINQSVEPSKKEYKNHDARGKGGKSECDNRNKTSSRIPCKIDSLVSDADGATAIGEENHLTAANVTSGGSVYQSEFLLGYSGNPFGSRQPISGMVELSDNNPLGRGVADPRKKRSVLHLYNMVLCTTGCNPFAYKGYGCYCGFLGSGFVVDGIDSCCKMHDWCYNTAGCPMFLEYFIPYLWQCHHHQPLCAINHGYYGGSGSCAQRLCECDRQLALCLRRYPCPSSKALCTSSPLRLLQNILML